LAVLQADQTVIGDGHPVGVAAEIAKNMLREVGQGKALEPLTFVARTLGTYRTHAAGYGRQLEHTRSNLGLTLSEQLAFSSEQIGQKLACG